MNSRCTIKGATLKAEVVKDDETSHVEVYWIVSFKIPAENIDANEINNMVGQSVDLTAQTVQMRIAFADEAKRKAAVA